MNDKEINDKLDFMVSELKKNFISESSDYHSGVNDGMYCIGKELIKKYEFRIAYLKKFIERHSDVQLAEPTIDE